MALEILVRSRRDGERSPKADSRDGRPQGPQNVEPQDTKPQDTKRQDSKPHETESREAECRATKLDDTEPRATLDQTRVANDNNEAWPLIPFPDGWYGC